jgi:hypothetical protein
MTGILIKGQKLIVSDDGLRHKAVDAVAEGVKCWFHRFEGGR